MLSSHGGNHSHSPSIDTCMGNKRNMLGLIQKNATQSIPPCQKYAFQK
uniref:Uncharacterized protein n=1 Tax=Anguilla anguilla TaxID=7936 RepID=A0A0E9S8F7_ANGAN